MRSEPADRSTGGETRHDHPAAALPLPPSPAPTPPSKEKADAVRKEARCSRCEADLARIAGSARFCPRCGMTLSAAPVLSPEASSPATSPPSPRPVLPLPEQPVTSAAKWMRLRDAHAAPVPPPTGGQHSALGNPNDVHSTILLGYAKAMYRLGRRYETALGTGRNVAEAIRCYFKAAKLGNSAALARLAPQCAGTPKPTPPTEPPGEAS